MSRFGIDKRKRKKGLGLILLTAVVACMVSGSGQKVQAANTLNTLVTKETVTAYNKHMVSVGINNGNDYGEYRVRDRAWNLMTFSNKNGNVLSANGHTMNMHSDNKYREYTGWKRGVTSAPSGQNLYMMEFSSNRDAKGNYDCSFAIVFEQDGYVRYTNIKDLDDEATDFLDHDQFKKDRREQVTFSLPSHIDRILGVYIENDKGGGDNDDPWGISYLNIYEAYNVGKVEEDIYGNTFRAFEGKLLAGVSEVDIKKDYLGGNNVNNGWLYCLMTPEVEYSHYTDSQYLMEVVTGDMDYQGSSITVKVEYKDAFGVSHTSQATMDKETFAKLQTRSSWGYVYYGGEYRGSQNKFSYFDYTSSKQHNQIRIGQSDTEWWSTREWWSTDSGKEPKLPLSSWADATATEMNLVAAAITGNYLPHAEFRNNFFRAYAETEIPITIAGGVKEVTSISLTLPSGSGQLSLQGLRLIDARVDLSQTYFNGCLSCQRIFDYEGTILAAFAGETVLATGETRGFTSGGDAHHKLQSVNEKIDNRNFDKMLGINLRLADVSGAGIETLAAGNKGFLREAKSSSGSVWSNWTEEEQAMYTHMEGYLQALNFLASDDEGITKNPYHKYTVSQLYNLMHSFWKEPLTLKVTYRDTLGARRVVEVPFLTAYVMELFTDNKAVFETAYIDKFLGGIFQQGQELALRLNLSQYQYLENLELIYDGRRDGTTPKGFFAVRQYINLDDDDTYPDLTLNTDKDTLSIRAVEVYENVGRSWFYNEYDTSINDIRLVKTGRVTRLAGSEEREFMGGTISIPIMKTENKSAEASYYFLSDNRKGATMSSGTKLFLSTAAGGKLKQGAAPDRNEDYKGTYLVRIVPTTGDADTQLEYRLGYTTTGGEQKETSLIPVSQATKDYYGVTGYREGVPGHPEWGGITEAYSDIPPALYGEEYQYMSHVVGDNGTYYARGKKKSPTTLCFLVELEDVSTIDSIYFSFSGKGKWQAQSVQVWKLDTLSARYCSGRNTDPSTQWKDGCTMPQGGYLWERDYTGTVVSKANRPVLFSKNNPTGTIYFSVLQPDGKTYADPEKTEEPPEYLEKRPESMTYEETLKDLGLAVPKRTYQVDVKVADVEDAGSNNYFYFQLVFENGTSGLVLANQQLASDSFRRNSNESFIIKTTQNFGAVEAVRIICDITSSDSQAFDKLNIESISVSQTTSGGIGKSYVVEHVGWVDINFRDEGESEVLNAETTMNLSNAEMIREYAVTKVSSNASLLFCLSSGGSSRISSYSTLGGAFDAVLTYENSDGITQTRSFNLLKQIYEYNESEEGIRLFRSNHTDRFVLTIPDISSIKQLQITRREGTQGSVWVGKNISVSQIGEIGRVFISVESDEYMRDTVLATPLTSSTNQNISITENGFGTFTFDENEIKLDTSDEDNGWSAQITRYPTGDTEQLNIYLYAGEGYEFSDKTPKLNGSVRYTSKFGGATQQKSFTLEQIGNVQGTTVLYANGVQTGAMSNLQKMFLESSTTEGTQPTIRAARVERVQNGVILETLYFDFGNKNLSGDPINALAQNVNANSNMKQLVCLQPVEDTSAIFQPETNDIAVALQYTSELDPKTTKTVYVSPYVFLTDVGIHSLYGGQMVEIPFDVDGVGEVVGLKVISSGTKIDAQNAIIYNYGENADGQQGTFLGSCQLSDAFTISTVAGTLMKETGTNVVPVTFTFTTPKETEMPGAGTSGKVQMEIKYVDITGNEQTKTIKNMLQYLPDNQQPTAGTEVSFELLMSNLSYIKSITLMPDSDDWYLTGIKAEAKKIDGLYTTVVTGASSVAKWAKPTEPLTIELNVESSITTGGSNGPITNLELSGTASVSGDTNTVKVGETLTMDVIPGDMVTLTASVTAKEGADTTLNWEPNGYMTLNESKTTATIQVSENARIGSKITTAVSCAADSTYRIPVELNVTSSEAKITQLKLSGYARQPEESVRSTVTAYAGETFEMEVYKGDRVVLMAEVTGNGNIDKSVEWTPDTTNYITDLSTDYLVFNIKTNETPREITTTITSKGNPQYQIPVKLSVVDRPTYPTATVTMEQVDADGNPLSPHKIYQITTQGNGSQVTFQNNTAAGVDHYIKHTTTDPDVYVKVTVTITGGTLVANGTDSSPFGCTSDITASHVVVNPGNTEVSGVFKLGNNNKVSSVRSCNLTCKNASGIMTDITVNFIEKW